MNPIKTMKDVMRKYKMRPKEFSEASGINYGTCLQISKGRPSPTHNVHAKWLDFGLSHGKTIDDLNKEVRK